MSLSDTTYFTFPPAQSQATSSAESPYSSSPYSTGGPDHSDFDLFQVPSLSPDFSFDQLQSLRGTSPFSYSSEFDATFGLPSGSSSAPSTAIISPKSTSSELRSASVESGTFFEPVSRTNTASPTIPWNFDLAQAQAASDFHNERSIFYKNQEQEQLARVKVYNEQLAALQLFTMPVDPNANLMANVTFDHNGIAMNNNMLGFQPQAQHASVPPPQFSGMPTWQTAPTALPPASLAEDYRAKAQQHAQAMQAFQAVQLSMSSMPAMSNAPTYAMPVDMTHASRSSSGSMSVSGSASMPTTPAGPVSVPMTTSVTAPSLVMSSGTASEGEPELDRMSVGSVVVNDDIEPSLPMGIPLINLNGGGRGYVPGQTPDDPKKRHKCNICHRGFARAYNLKVSCFDLPYCSKLTLQAHIDTHNPVRPKPHTCPHKSCGRGFSRLHDLERHRQGIHSDGPLVDAKQQGVAPSVARAKNRIQKRAETGSLV